MLRYLADEDLDHRIVRGLRRAAPEIDIVRAQDVSLGAHSDDDVLLWAAQNNRLAVTHDVSTMPAAAYRRLTKGQAIPGVVIVPQRMSIGQAIDDLAVLALVSEPHEWRDQVVYLPL